MTCATDQRLLLLVERIERLEEEKRGIAQDIGDVYAEAKAVGYDARLVRQLVKRRRMKPDDRAEADAVLESYECAVGLGGTQPHAVVAPKVTKKSKNLGAMRAAAGLARLAAANRL